MYLTDNIKFVKEKINHRKDKYIFNLKSKWNTATPIFEITKEGEKLLKIFNLEVMSDFQKPYMKVLANNATVNGGNILNIGFGLGLVDGFIQEKEGIDEHHIVELNQGVFDEAKKWRDKQKNRENIFLYLGNWEDVLFQLKEKNICFDGVVYDAYPLEVHDICRDSIPFIDMILKLKLIREEVGILTFYLDSDEGIGKEFRDYLSSLGVQEVHIQKVDVELPKNGKEYWDLNYFIAPLLTGIKYS